MKIIIFGTGSYYEKNKKNKDIIEQEIVAFLDNDKSKAGNLLDGKKIYHPLQLQELVYDRIFIMSSYFSQMEKQLLELGVKKERIVYYPLGGYEYHHWFLKQKIGKEERKKQKETQLEYSPLISIIVPTYNTPEKFLKEMIESVLDQTYGNWELCIADGSTKMQTKKYLMEYEEKDKRINVLFLKENLGISENTNRAVAMAQGEYLAFLDHDDLLEPDALYEVVVRLKDKIKPDFLYTDEDKIEADGAYFFWPFFKPDYSPDLLISYAYILHLMVVSRKLFDKTGGFDSRFDGAQDHDLSLRLTEKAEKIVHIPKVLYHWRSHMDSMAGNIDSKQYGVEADTRAVNEFLNKQNPKGHIVKRIGIAANFQVEYELIGYPLVSIIIVTDEYNIRIQEIWKKNKNYIQYSNIEFIIVCKKQIIENNCFTIIKCEQEMSKVQCRKEAIKQSKGNYLIFLECDSIVKNSDYIEQLLMQCQRECVGIVGSKMEDFNGSTISAGLILGNEIEKGYIHIGQDQLYFGRNEVARNLSAVCGNGMMIKRQLYNEIGGISEEYEQAYWDIDLCLKVIQKKNILYTPLAIITKKNLNESYNQKDKIIFQKKWMYFLEKTDSYYNKFISMKLFDIKRKDNNNVLFT